ncbi:MFS transporter [Nonomuraea sp. NPDC050328]|uniref:MFS transporter n=1 Tax=Nonomuraea sp. NPDC050328 TaxID=3364361 RepID=UPI003792EE11
MFTVAVGTFTVVTSEMLPVGLLTPIARDLGVSEGTAGLMVGVPGLVAALAAASLPAAAGRVDRRTVLLSLAGLLIVANAAAALAPSFAVLLAARVLVGVAIGGFWALAGSVGPRLVPPSSAGRAVAIVTGGVAVASVLGVPAGTFLADRFDWRWAFGAMAIVAALVLVALAALLPSLPADGGARLRDALRSRALRPIMIVTGLLIAGHFAAYTYVRPVLSGVSDLDPSLLLLAYGAAGILGNFVLGPRAAGGARRVLLVMAAGIAVTAPLTAVLGWPALLAWGLAYGGVGVAVQLWVFEAGIRVREAGLALLTMVFNLAIALGSVLGGVAVDALSASGAVWLGAGLAVAGLIVAAAWRRAPEPA